MREDCSYLGAWAARVPSLHQKTIRLLIKSSTMSQMQLIYVAGYGRSGSTLLDTLLGNAPGVFGAGELSRLYWGTLNGLNCSCGDTLQNCSFWESVRERVFQECNMDCSKAASLTWNAECLTSRGGGTVAYGELWNATLQAVVDISGKQVIVDSSKSDRSTNRRLHLLSQYLNHQVKAIHLVRDPRAVMWSLARGRNTELENGAKDKRRGRLVRGLLGWTAVNLTVDREFRRNRELAQMRLRYSELVCDFERTAQSLQEFLGISMREVVVQIQRGSSLNAGHGVAGNRMRRAGKIVLKYDDEWRKRLPGTARAMSVIAWPLMRKYGF
jgi:sulfotransferase family protein